LRLTVETDSYSVLLARHRLGRATLNLVAFLYEGAEGTEDVHEAIVAVIPLDALGLPDLAADLGAGPDADGPQRGQAPVRAAALAHSLSVLAGRDEGQEVGDDADAAVAEAAAQAICPLAHGGWLLCRAGGEKWCLG